MRPTEGFQAAAPHRGLDPARIIKTAEKLSRRISERFPASGLAGVAEDFVALSRDLSQEASDLARPIWPARALVGLAVAGGVVVFVFVGTIFSFNRIFAQSVNDAVVVEAVNDVENLGSNLSRKIWQKITLVEEFDRRRRG